MVKKLQVLNQLTTKLNCMINYILKHSKAAKIANKTLS